MNIIERIDRPCEYVEVAQTALIACQYLYLCKGDNSLCM